MKNLNCLLFAAMIMTLAITVSCNNDDNGSEGSTLAEEQLDKLTDKVWAVESVTRDGSDITDNYEGFTISFDGTLVDDGENVNGTYTTTNPLLIFKENGTWTFGESVESTIIKDGNLTMNYDAGAFLTLSFNFQGEGLESGRVAGLNGDYVFLLK